MSLISPSYLSQGQTATAACGDSWQPTYNSQLGLAAQSRPGIGVLDQSTAGQLEQHSYLIIAGTALLYCSTLTDHSHSQPHVCPVAAQRYLQDNLMMRVHMRCPVHMLSLVESAVQ